MSGEGDWDDYAHMKNQFPRQSNPPPGNCDHCGYLLDGPKHQELCLTHKPTNPKDRAATSRLDFSLVPTSAIAYAALAFTEGDAKYGGYNWRVAGVSASVYIAASLRHISKFYNGEECDDVSKVPHLGSAIACLAVVIDSIEMGNLNDDRPPPLDMGGILTRAESIVKHLHSIYPNGPDRVTHQASMGEDDEE